MLYDPTIVDATVAQSPLLAGSLTLLEASITSPDEIALPLLTSSISLLAPATLLASAITLPLLAGSLSLLTPIVVSSAAVIPSTTTGVAPIRRRPPNPYSPTEVRRAIQAEELVTVDNTALITTINETLLGVQSDLDAISDKVDGGVDPGHSHTGASLSGIDISDDTNLTVSSPITLTDDDIGLDETAVDHDNLLNFVATKHFDTTTLSAGSVVISNGTTFIEDNVGLFFDTTSNRLGIGSSSPQKNLHILHVTPTIRISDSNASTDQEVTGLIEFYRGNTTNRVGYVAMTSHTNDILALATDYANGEIRLRTGNAVDRLIIDKDGDVSILGNVVINGQLGLNITPTARITLPAGTATAGTAPLKLTSGIPLTSPEAGAIEFTTDSIYFTITTGAARKYIALTEGLTSGQITFATTNGRLTDAAALTWDGTTLLTTRVAINTSGQSVTFTAYYGANSDGRNIWIGGGGLSALGAIGQTFKGARNVSLGGNALFSNTIGYGNIAVGYQALSSNTSGANNVAIGSLALRVNLGGSGNVAIGSSALLDNTSGNNNFALGTTSLHHLVSGINNVAIGVNAGKNVTGNYNMAIGTNALQTTTGSNNVGIGQSALFTTTGSGNVGIGGYAGIWETGSNKLFIDNVARASEADGRVKALVYGIFAATTAAQYFTVNGHVIALEDLETPIVLTPEIKTDTSTPTDLTITTGAAKTLILATSVYVDLQFPVATGKITPASGEPSWETFTTNTKEYAFGVNDYIDLQANELFHHWKEGTNGHVHIHGTIKTAQSTGFDRFAKFSVWVSYSDKNEVWVEQAVLSGEVTIPTGSSALQAFYLDVGDAVLTNYLRGGQVKVRVKRIGATSGTEYAGDVFITQVGMHLEIDKVGSVVEED